MGTHSPLLPLEPPKPWGRLRRTGDQPSLTGVLFVGDSSIEWMMLLPKRRVATVN